MQKKSHFIFSKRQRNGIFLLLLIIVGLQCIYFFVDFTSEVTVSDSDVIKINAQIDSLKQQIALYKRKPKIYPFNPNFITDYKGSLLGMTTQEIDRLFTFRAKNQWIYSAKQFQNVTKISDSLLQIISPYFKFPDWVTHPKKSSKRIKTYAKNIKSVEKKDLNKVTAQELQVIKGIGIVLSNRIVKYRNKFIGGFIADIQLQDVYGLKPEVIARITEKYTVQTPRQVNKVNLNKATVNDLVMIQHIDYDVAFNIIEERRLKGKYKHFKELLKVKDFPINKIDIIKLYLSLY